MDLKEVLNKLLAWQLTGTIDDATEMADRFDLHFSTIVDKLPSGPSSIPTDLSKLVSFVDLERTLKSVFQFPPYLVCRLKT